MQKINPKPIPAADQLAGRVIVILEQARAQVVRSVNSQMVLAYWLIGREVVQALQGGEQRATYGTQLLEGLSAQLTQRYGRGYSVTSLKSFRIFYLAYEERNPVIRQTASAELPGAVPAPQKSSRPIRHTRSAELVVAAKSLLDDDTPLHALAQALQDRAGQGFSPQLSFSHYRALSALSHNAERQFYETEAEKERWSLAVLERQIHSYLYARLLKSRDKTGVLALASQGQQIERPVDIIKHPYVLDFLGLPEAAQWHESDLEGAIINRLQPFLLELGKGFAFVGRQYRVGTEAQHFYIDLVFYNYLLKCFVLVDLKMGRLSHQDAGQMDMYVRMFDDLQRGAGDNPSVGLILCAERDEVVARYSVLHETAQLFAAKYMLYLPSEAQLQRELLRGHAPQGASPNASPRVPVDLPPAKQAKPPSKPRRRTP